MVGVEVPPATPPLQALQLYVLTTTRVASAKLYASKLSPHGSNVDHNVQTTGTKNQCHVSAEQNPSFPAVILLPINFFFLKCSVLRQRDNGCFRPMELRHIYYEIGFVGRLPLIVRKRSLLRRGCLFKRNIMHICGIIVQ